jgi:hypothetical protein
MAVLAEALSVIVRREAIARRYPGGWPAFTAEVDGKSFCADTELARVGFMHPDEVGLFVERLNGVGFVFLDETGTARDVVVVDQREGPTTACGWIEFFRQEVPGGTISAVRMVDGKDQTLMCPDGWQFEGSLSSAFRFVPAENAHALQFVRHEAGVDVYLDRSSGEEAFVARPNRYQSSPGDHPNDSASMHDGLFRQAAELLQPVMEAHFGHEGPVDSAKQKADLVRAQLLLQRVTSLSRQDWNAWWALGMTCRLLGDRIGAHDAFRHAYDIAPAELEVGRNLVEECIALGRGPEAVDVATALTGRFPNDAGLVANRALALLVNGAVDDARVEVDRALEMSPGDQVTINLRTLIEGVVHGVVTRPATWPPG